LWPVNSHTRGGGRGVGGESATAGSFMNRSHYLVSVANVIIHRGDAKGAEKFSRTSLKIQLP
jgi:hypothetical protein